MREQDEEDSDEDETRAQKESANSKRMQERMQKLKRAQTGDNE